MTGAARLMALWREDRGLTALLALLVLDVFVAYPASPAGVVLDGVSRGLATLLLLAGSLAVARGRRARYLVAGLYAVTIVVNWAALSAAHPAWQAGRGLLSLLSLLVMCALLLGQVSRAGPVTAHRVRGAIAAYLLIAVIFGHAYWVVETLRPGAFTLPSWWAGARPRQVEAFYYFSIVTLTTLGYGDMVPVHPVARSLTTAEALIGQLYPAILIARLVSLQIETRRATRETRGDGGSGES